MEANFLVHITLTICCCLLLFLFGFYCLRKKELVFFVIIVMAVKSAMLLSFFQLPGLFNSNFFVDSKAYVKATHEVAQYVQRELSFPSFETYEKWSLDINYFYALINAIVYLVFPSASTGFLLNAFFYQVALLLFYYTFWGKGESRAKELTFLILLFWPSLFFNSLLFIRDGLIVVLTIIFLALYSRHITLSRTLLMIGCLLLVAALRWYVGFSLLLFVVGDWILSVYKRSRLVFVTLTLAFLVGLAGIIVIMGFTPETIQTFRNVLTGLEGNYNANSVYLQWFIIDSYPKLLLFVPFSMFSFLFSPLVPLGGNPLSLVAVMENISLLLMAGYAWWPAKEVAVQPSKLLQNALLFSLPLLLVYAFGVADSGTAIRQKGFLIFIIVFAFFKKLEWRTKRLK